MARLALSKSLFLPFLMLQAVAAPLLAQVTTGADGRTVVPRDTANAEEHKTLFTYRDAALAAGFVGLTFAMFPVDRRIAERLQDPELRANKFFDNSAKGVEYITTPGSFFIGSGLYVAGKLTKNKNLSDLGWHGTEAIMLSSGITSLLKGTLGRARPYVTSDTNPHDFKFLRGFQGSDLPLNPQTGKPYGQGDYQSFPSGHTTTAFAAAAAVTSETRRIWPGAVWFVAPAMYGGATLVGLSRMYHNNHWASDVVLGAAIGTFSGLKVVRYSHAHPDNKLDKLILGATVIPHAEGGATVAFTIPVP
ncbi:MAG TPA: phosphatase PAP2 family protein [Vicinamibacterales bacterium]|nr:phosphatase PAP2 family protein [Vicinamibacterales bacterium]